VTFWDNVVGRAKSTAIRVCLTTRRAVKVEICEQWSLKAIVDEIELFWLRGGRNIS